MFSENLFAYHEKGQIGKDTTQRNNSYLLKYLLSYSYAEHFTTKLRLDLIHEFQETLVEATTYVREADIVFLFSREVHHFIFLMISTSPHCLISSVCKLCIQSESHFVYKYWFKFIITGYSIYCDVE